ncbi:hypothetical protein TKK_0013813 [Trichogramma kaykai]|uniref:Uncharacterized protein n=1 Tax=Trichogramma kaykai TaxID=54128 RepID=A0ABD2WHI9_9HYME
MSTPRSSLRITIDIVDRAECEDDTLIMQSNSRSRLHDQRNDETTSVDDEEQMRRMRFLRWSNDVITAALLVTAEEAKEPRLASLSQLPRLIEQQRGVNANTRLVATPPSTITIEEYSDVSDISITEYIVNDTRKKIIDGLHQERRRRRNGKFSSSSDSNTVVFTDNESYRSIHNDESGYTTDSGYYGTSLID